MFELLYRMQAPVWKGLSPGVVWEHGSVGTADVCKEFKRLYIAWVFSPTGVHPVNWEGGTVPLKTAALAAKERCSIYHAGEEKGLPVKLGPGEQLFSRISAPLFTWGSQFILPCQSWEWKFLRWPPPIQQRSRALECSCPRSSREYLPFS